MRLRLISCEVLYREMCACIARSPHQVDIEFLPQGLHNLGGVRMRPQLQQAVDRTDDSRYDAILLGYGLCGNGIAGLTARSLRMVIPRAHDCITLLMGSRQRYLDYFHEHSGVYFRSTGWLERAQSLVQLNPNSAGEKTLSGYDLDQLIARYGEENGRYLFEQFNSYQRAYSQITFIKTGLEPDASFEQRASGEAARRGWQFEQISGDLGLLQRLISGDWNEQEFLVVPPGCRVVAQHDPDILGFEKAPS